MGIHIPWQVTWWILKNAFVLEMHSHVSVAADYLPGHAFAQATLKRMWVSWT